MITRRPALLAGAVAVPLAALYLAFTPQTGDLAAATYRANLVSRVGALIWDNGWYGGHHLPGYSVLMPPLAALLGPALLAALAAVLGAVLFALIAQRERPGAPAALASAWLAAGLAVSLLSGRVPYTLGETIGLGAVLAAQRRQTAAGALLAVCAALASPVAGAFVALAGVTFALRGDRRAGAALVLGGLVPVLALTAAFPEGGTEPFAAGAFWPGFALVLGALAALPREERALRIGGALYAAALAGSYVIPSAVGGNTARLGSLLAGPLLALALAGRRSRVLLALAPLLVYWQIIAPLHDTEAVAGNASVHRAFYAPLLAHLPPGPRRIEIPLTRGHWEAVYVAPHVAIARGWERQLDEKDNRLFYRADLTAASYHAWLEQNAISYVALANTSLDPSARAEARLISAGLPYLREVWRSAHWRLFAVRDPTPMVSAGGELLTLGVQSFSLRAPAPGAYLVRVHFTPYWALAGDRGCVSRAPGDWTLVRLDAPGLARVAIRFSLTRVFGHGPRCD